MSGLTAVRSGSIAAVDLSEPLQTVEQEAITYWLTHCWLRIVGSQYQWAPAEYGWLPRLVNGAPGPSSVPTWTKFELQIGPVLPSSQSKGSTYWGSVFLGGNDRYYFGSTTAIFLPVEMFTITRQVARGQAYPPALLINAPAADSRLGVGVALPRTARRGQVSWPWRRRG